MNWDEAVNVDSLVENIMLARDALPSYATGNQSSILVNSEFDKLLKDDTFSTPQKDHLREMKALYDISGNLHGAVSAKEKNGHGKNIRGGKRRPKRRKTHRTKKRRSSKKKKRTKRKRSKTRRKRR
jgi:hypothetical protein